MPRKKSKTRMYFTEETEAAIVAYNSTDSHREKNAIYNEHLRKPFEKLVENIIHTFKFYYFDIPIESVKHEVISFMITRLDKYKQGKGKAFSYFSVVVKNWLICHNNNNYKKMKTHNDVLDLKHKDVKNTSYDDNTVKSQEEKEFFNSIIDYWEENIDKVFKKERDIKIAYSIIELMSRVDSIEIFNKKALYILLREISGHNTQHITRVLNVMRGHYKNLHTKWDKEGDIAPIVTKRTI
tara:strand:+ start:5412 stop:6128 length:717 start_codon:yes stop_codon:yes gene_type:complete